MLWSLPHYGFLLKCNELTTGKQEKPEAKDKVLVCIGMMIHTDLFQELQTTNCKTLVRIDTGTRDSAFEKKSRNPLTPLTFIGFMRMKLKLSIKIVLFFTFSVLLRRSLTSHS